MKSRIEIPLSKTKLSLMLIGAIVFCVLGVLLIKDPQEFVSHRKRSPEFARIVGIASVCFFGICLIFITRKLFDNMPGLVIDDCGIVHNANATSMGLIEWDDITKIERTQIASNNFLILYTSDPVKYIRRAKDVLSRKAMEINNKIYGSPITITSNALKIGFEELEVLVKTEFSKARNGCSGK